MNNKRTLLISISLTIWLLLITGCSSAPTVYYFNTYGNISSEDDYVTVNIRRKTGIGHYPIYIIEYAIDDKFTGVLGVQDPLGRDSYGAKLWSPDAQGGIGCIGPRRRGILITRRNSQKRYVLSDMAGFDLTPGSKWGAPSILTYDDIINFIFEEGENHSIYPVENGKYIRSVSFHKVAIIGTVANNDIFTWKRPPGSFRIRLLFAKDHIGRFFESDIIVTEPGESVYVDLGLTMIAKDIRRGWTKDDMFKKITKEPF